LIFLSVGTQFGFDRLVKAVDSWASKNLNYKIIAQIGAGKYSPSYLECYNFIDPEIFNQYQSEAKIIIGHAGMGTILTALELGKPVIVMPRLERFGEHRNDHQLATARKMINKAGVFVANDERELIGLLDRADEIVGQAVKIGKFASTELIVGIDKFICGALNNDK